MGNRTSEEEVAQKMATGITASSIILEVTNAENKQRETFYEKAMVILNKHSGRRKLGIHLVALWRLSSVLYATDWPSAIRTDEVVPNLPNSRVHKCLEELEEIDGLVKRRFATALYHFRDELGHNRFDQAGAAIVEARNYREFEQHMINSPEARQIILDISRLSSVAEVMELIRHRDSYHTTYNKIVRILKEKHLTNRRYGEMGWRRNSDYWYLTPKALRYLSV